jgi:hypothetical protein
MTSIIKPARAIEAKVETDIKQFPVADSDNLNSSQKFPLLAGDKLDIESYEDDPSFNNHYKIKLKISEKGFIFWYAFIDHIDVIE